MEIVNNDEFHVLYKYNMFYKNDLNTEVPVVSNNGGIKIVLQKDKYCTGT